MTFLADIRQGTFRRCAPWLCLLFVCLLALPVATVFEGPRRETSLEVPGQAAALLATSQSCQDSELRPAASPCLALETPAPLPVVAASIVLVPSHAPHPGHLSPILLQFHPRPPPLHLA